MEANGFVSGPRSGESGSFHRSADRLTVIAPRTGCGTCPGTHHTAECRWTKTRSLVYLHASLPLCSAASCHGRGRVLYLRPTLFLLVIIKHSSSSSSSNTLLLHHQTLFHLLISKHSSSSSSSHTLLHHQTLFLFIISKNSSSSSVNNSLPHH